MQKAFVTQARHVLETRWVGGKEKEGKGEGALVLSKPAWLSCHITIQSQNQTLTLAPPPPLWEAKVWFED